MDTNNPGSINRQVSVDVYEANTHSFIVKIWLEETAEEAGEAMWRGYITHVPTGTHCYIKNLNEITDFVLPYCARMGIKFGLRWRVSRWIKQWKII